MGNAKLSKAVCELNVNEMNRLLSSGKCSVNGHKSDDKPPPIILCVSEGFGREGDKRCEIMKLLVRYGAHLDVQRQTRSWLFGKTAAMIAAERGYLKCLEVLVSSGADLNIKNPSGDTALNLAVKWAQHECARILIDKMSPPMLDHKNEYGENALLMAASNPEFNYFLCMKHLVEAGAATDVRDREGNTVLMLSASLQQEDRVRYLIEHISAPNLKINEKNKDGQTALMLAASKEVGETSSLCVQHLLALGADLDITDNHGNTALALASNSNNSEAVKVLREKEAALREMHSCRCHKYDDM